MRARVGPHEMPLVFFTVLTQAAAGACAMRAVLAPEEPVDAVVLALLALGVLAAVSHLGRPTAARLAIANPTTSWLSREIVVGSVFGTTVLAHLLLGPNAALRIAAAALGLLYVYAVSRVYLLRTVPAWNTWATPVSFLLTALLLGSAVLGLGAQAAALAALQLVVAWVGFGRPDPLRVVGTAAGAALLFVPHPAAIGAACVLLFAAEMLGRYRFYALHERLGL